MQRGRVGPAGEIRKGAAEVDFVVGVRSIATRGANAQQQIAVVERQGLRLAVRRVRYSPPAKARRSGNSSVFTCWRRFRIGKSDKSIEAAPQLTSGNSQRALNGTENARMVPVIGYVLVTGVLRRCELCAVPEEICGSMQTNLPSITHTNLP